MKLLPTKPSTLLMLPVLAALMMAATASMAASYVAVNCNGEPISEGVPHPNGGGLIFGAAQVDDSVYVGRKSVICGGTVSGNVVVKGRSVVVYASVSGNVVVRDSLIHRAAVSGSARIIEGSVWSGATVSGNARILDGAAVRGAGPKVYGNARVVGFDTNVLAYGEVYGSAVVRGGADILGKVDCGRWSGVTVTTDQTGKCGKHDSAVSDSALSNPINAENTESE